MTETEKRLGAVPWRTRSQGLWFPVAPEPGVLVITGYIEDETPLAGQEFLRITLPLPLSGSEYIIDERGAVSRVGPEAGPGPEPVTPPSRGWVRPALAVGGAFLALFYLSKSRK